MGCRNKYFKGGWEKKGALTCQLILLCSTVNRRLSHSCEVIFSECMCVTLIVLPDTETPPMVKIKVLEHEHASNSVLFMSVDQL